MKLYTEEEIKRLLKEQIIFDDEDFDKLIPIKLPSDEEIEKYFTHDLIFGVYRVDYNKVEGAKWMRDKIQGGNNG